MTTAMFALTLTAGAQSQTVQTALVQTALVHHAVSTVVPAAQSYFDQGLTLIYAFNRDEAARRFLKAAQADPSLAMAWWGVALANGPNLNFDMDAKRVRAAHDALSKAKALEISASPEEVRYIEALAVRYPAKPVSKDEEKTYYAAYRDAMAKLHADFPDDLDAATLYAESVMDVDDTGWTGDKPTPATALIVGVLESVLARDPNHVGANHYYVHTMDYIGVAQRALPSAERLSALPAEPAASHLVHMSGHIYLDVGMFGPLERDNRTAIDDDRTYAASLKEGPEKLDYYQHNLDFYLGGALMLDDIPEAERALGFAKQSKDGTAILLGYARERRWDDVLSYAEPTDSFTLTVWHYVRGIARAEVQNTIEARAELAALQATMAGAKGFRERAGAMLALLLGARVAHLEGDDATAVKRLREVVATAATLPPEVFSPWYFPAGEWLGGLLLGTGDLAGAEAAYRADLTRTPHNARSLYGLQQTLIREGRTAEARALADEIAANWRGPQSDLRLDD
jgi:hypothetical protein